MYSADNGILCVVTIAYAADNDVVYAVAITSADNGIVSAVTIAYAADNDMICASHNCLRCR